MTAVADSPEGVDYFKNHKNKLRFPWRLYHAPIVRELGQELTRHDVGAVQSLHAGAGARSTSGAFRVLNVGSGPFLELRELPAMTAQFSLCDIDPRAMDMARQLHGDKVEATDVIEPGSALPHPSNSFDMVVSMDVIEHVPSPDPWTRELFRVLKPGGHLFLTTPNYGFSTLSLIERTVLEAIARFQGFSRRDLHPSKFSGRSLDDTLTRCGFRNVAVRHISFGWVLAATATKP